MGKNKFDDDFLFLRNELWHEINRLHGKDDPRTGRMMIEYVDPFVAIIRRHEREKISQELARPQLGDFDYSSGHSIDADGNCSMGCC